MPVMNLIWLCSRSRWFPYLGSDGPDAEVPFWRYPMGAYLKEQDKSLAAKALGFHPRRDAKIGAGIKEIKVLNELFFIRADVLIHAA